MIVTIESWFALKNDVERLRAETSKRRSNLAAASPEMHKMGNNLKANTLAGLDARYEAFDIVWSTMEGLRKDVDEAYLKILELGRDNDRLNAVVIDRQELERVWNIAARATGLNTDPWDHGWESSANEFLSELRETYRLDGVQADDMFYCGICENSFMPDRVVRFGDRMVSVDHAHCMKEAVELMTKKDI